MLDMQARTWMTSDESAMAPAQHTRVNWRLITMLCMNIVVWTSIAGFADSLT